MKLQAVWPSSPLYQLYHLILYNSVSRVLSHISCFPSPLLSHVSCLTSPVSLLQSYLMSPVSRLMSHISCLTSPTSRLLSYLWRDFLFNKKFALGGIRTHNLPSHICPLYQFSYFSFL